MKMGPTLSVILLAGVVSMLSILAGCGEKKPSSGLPTVQMNIGTKMYALEIAATDESMQRGLMHRDSMPADHGMIFVFPDEDDRSFWMRNTRIPLDIIYVSGAGKVVSVKSMKPYDEKPVPSEGKAKFAIELNQGQAAQAGVKAGDTITIPPEITKLPGPK